MVVVGRALKSSSHLMNGDTAASAAIGRRLGGYCASRTGRTDPQRHSLWNYPPPLFLLLFSSTLFGCMGGGQVLSTVPLGTSIKKAALGPTRAMAMEAMEAL